MNIAQLMPRPYSRFHATYLANYRKTGVAKVVGDSRGRMVTVRASARPHARTPPPPPPTSRPPAAHQPPAPPPMRGLGGLM